MIHAKFRGNRPVGSGEDFRRDFTIYGQGDHLGHVTRMPRTNFRPPTQGGSTLAKRFQRRRCLKLWTSTDGRTPDDGYTIRLTYEP